MGPIRECLLRDQKAHFHSYLVRVKIIPLIFFKEEHTLTSPELCEPLRQIREVRTEPIQKPNCLKTAPNPSPDGSWISLPVGWAQAPSRFEQSSATSTEHRESSWRIQTGLRKGGSRSYHSLAKLTEKLREQKVSKAFPLACTTSNSGLVHLAFCSLHLKIACL